MGFFQQNGAAYADGAQFSVAEDGVYLCRLKEVEPIQSPSFEDPNILQDQFKFVFETTDAADENGQPYRFTKYTKRNYGNEKAALTLLIDGMLGRHLTPDEWNGLDLDDLMARRYRVCVEWTQNGKGNDINKITWVKTPEGRSGGPGGAQKRTLAAAAGAPAAQNRAMQAAGRPQGRSGGAGGAAAVAERGDFPEGEDPFAE